MPEHGSLSWELSQTLGSEYLFGCEHIRLSHVYVKNFRLTPTLNRLVTQTLSEPATGSYVNSDVFADPNQ